MQSADGSRRFERVRRIAAGTNERMALMIVAIVLIAAVVMFGICYVISPEQDIRAASVSSEHLVALTMGNTQ